MTNDDKLEIIRLAVKMRDAQKAYFKGRASSQRLDLLIEARSLETQFDKRVEEVFKQVDSESNVVAKLLNQGVH